MHRLFIAINLPDSVKNSISHALDRAEEGLPRGAFRFLSPDTWHITLAFLGNQPDSIFTGILGAMADASKKMPSFSHFSFEEICFAPYKKIPEMIWLSGGKETSQQLGMARDILVDSLIERGVRFRADWRPFSAHITLARRDQAQANLPSLHTPLLVRVPFKQIDLMESHLGGEIPDYDLLSTSSVG